MSEQFLATASVRIVPDVTGFAAALQAQVTAATAAVRLPAASAAAGASAALTSATRAQTVAQNKLIGSTEILNVTKKQQATLDKIAADAAKIETDQLARQALAADQAARGFSTAAASAAGLRGAVLASSGPFLAAVIGFEAIKKSVEEASQTQEAAARVTKVLGEEAGHASEIWGKQLADSFGLSTLAALKFEGAIAEVFHNVGLNTRQTEEFSQRLVELSSDVAAFNNADPSQVLRAFQLGLSGNLRGLRQFIPGVTAARVALRAMADTGKDVKADLTDQELAVARYEVILEKASNQVGSFADRQNNLAVQSRVLKSNIADLADTAGGILVPALSILAKAASDSVKGLRLVADLAKEAAPATEDAAHKTTLFGEAMHGLGVAAHFAGPALVAGLGGELGILSRQIQTAAEQTRLMAQETRDLAGDPLRQMLSGLLAVDSGLGSMVGPINTIDTLLHFLIDTFGQTGQAAQTLGQQLQAALSTAQHQLLDLQFQGASSATQIQNLQRQIAINQQLIRHPGRGGQKTIDQARQDRNAAQQQIKSIQASDAAAAKAAASAAEAAAKRAAAEAEAARKQHDQDILTAQEFAQNDVELAKLKAQRTKSLVDDVAADKVQLRLIDEQIKDAQNILDATLRKQTIDSLRLAREQAAQQLTADRQAQIQRQKDHRDLILSRTQQRLELDIEIASTNKAKSAEIKAREARIAFDREQLKTIHGDIVRKKQLQLEIAQDTQAIKDLKKAKQDNMGATLGFIELQTQQGFVSNLLSNLLSTSATAGTVGGTAGAISTATGPQLSGGTGIAPSGSSGGGSFSAGGGFDVTTDVRADAQTSGGPPGVSSGQMATLIHVQRQMLLVLMRMVGQRTHPEATHQRTWAATEMLNTGW